MPRCFREHDQRQVVDLDGIWDFAFLGDVEPQSVDVEALTYPDRMAVPGCFDATPAYTGRRGLTAYHTRIRLIDATPHRIIFEGVNHWCRVFVDGKAIRDHVGGFTRFNVDLTDYGPGDLELVVLVVLVDNRIDAERCPLHLGYYDWYHFGGIARSVSLHRLGELWIDDLRVVTDDLTVPTVSVTVTYAAVVAPGPTQLVITCDNRVVLKEQINLASTSGEIVRKLELTGAGLWSPASPNLHLFHVRLGQDDRFERIGIRQVRVDGQQVLLNGQPLRLLGFNRHESHPQFGHSQPDSLLVADIQQLKDLGCNFVRGSHYPQDPRFLDLCDEVGICVWSEAIGWQNTAEHLTDARFIAAQQAHLSEMVRAAANHPALIIWGLLNEGHSHDERCRPTYRQLIGHIRSLDPTRPVTYASNQPFGDVCFDLADIVSINTYPGWYVGGLDDIPTELDRLMAHLNAGNEANKPVIISEIGAGAIPGWRDGRNGRWTEQYQSELLEMIIRHLFVERQRVCGLGIWLYNDFRTPDSVWRPRGINDKGVVDEYRRPKAAYETVKRQFRSL